MTNKDQAGMAVSCAGAIGFGFWMHSAGAGVFMWSVLVFIAVLCVEYERRGELIKPMRPPMRSELDMRTFSSNRDGDGQHGRS